MTLAKALITLHQCSSIMCLAFATSLEIWHAVNSIKASILSVTGQTHLLYSCNSES